MAIFGRRRLFASFPVAALMSATAWAQPLKVRFGTASEGGGFVVYGGAFVDAIKLVDPGLGIAQVTTRGSTENVPLLEAGKIDIGLVLGDVAHELFAGVGQPPTNLKVVSVMYSAPGMFAVRTDTRYRSITDLKGQRIVWNGRGSGLAIQGRHVMEGLGLDAEKDFEPIYVEQLTQGPTMVLEGDAAALWGAGYRWPGFVTIASNPRRARFVVPTSGEIDRIIAKHGFMRRLTVPAGVYPGQPDPISTVGSWSFVLARADLPEAIGYRLAAALHRAGSTTLSSKQLSESTPGNTLAALPAPGTLHPGVERFYKEAGFIKPPK
jgi:TRAP transporter TAXI family solute receptor